MDATDVFVPLAFFAMIAYITKLISDNRIRRKIIDAPISEEMAQVLLRNRRPTLGTQSALKWGIMLLSLGVGVLVVEALSFGFESPVAYAILFLAAGIALLGFYLIERGETAEDDSLSEDADIAGSGPSGESTAESDASEPVPPVDVE